MRKQITHWVISMTLTLIPLWLNAGTPTVIFDSRSTENPIITGTISDPDYSGALRMGIYIDTIGANSSHSQIIYPTNSFSFTLPSQFYDGQPHTVYFVAVDINSSGGDAGGYEIFSTSYQYVNHLPVISFDNRAIDSKVIEGSIRDDNYSGALRAGIYIDSIGSSSSYSEIIYPTNSFNFSIPAQFYDGQNHTVYFTAVDFDWSGSDAGGYQTFSTTFNIPETLPSNRSPTLTIDNSIPISNSHPVITATAVDPDYSGAIKVNIYVDNVGPDSNTPFNFTLPTRIRDGKAHKVYFLVNDHLSTGADAGGYVTYTKDYNLPSFFIDLIENATSSPVTIEFDQNAHYCVRKPIVAKKGISYILNGNGATITQCSLFAGQKINDLSAVFKERISQEPMFLFHGAEDTASSFTTQVKVTNLNGHFTPENDANFPDAQNQWWAQWYALPRIEQTTHRHAFLLFKNNALVEVDNVEIKDFVSGIIVENKPIAITNINSSIRSAEQYNIKNVKFDGIADNLENLIPLKKTYRVVSAPVDNNPGVYVEPTTYAKAPITYQIINKVPSTLPGLGYDLNNRASEKEDFPLGSGASSSYNWKAFRYYDDVEKKIITLGERVCTPYGIPVYLNNNDQAVQPGSADIVKSYSDNRCLLGGYNMNAVSIRYLWKPCNTVTGCQRNISNIDAWNSGAAVLIESNHNDFNIENISCNVAQNLPNGFSSQGVHLDNCVYISLGQNGVVKNIKANDLYASIVKARAYNTDISDISGHNVQRAVLLSLSNYELVNSDATTTAIVGSMEVTGVRGATIAITESSENISGVALNNQVRLVGTHKTERTNNALISNIYTDVNCTLVSQSQNMLSKVILDTSDLNINSNFSNKALPETIKCNEEQ